jgi:hypothetical protein
VLITRDQSARVAVKSIKPDAYGVGLDMSLVYDRALSLDLSPVACGDNAPYQQNYGHIASNARQGRSKYLLFNFLTAIFSLT